MVMFAAEVPDDRTLVVRANASTTVWHALLLAAVALDVAVFAAILVLAFSLGFPLLVVLAILVPFAVQGLLIGLVAREYQGLRGPQLAADHTGVWVRTGLGPRPEVVYLPWPAIEGIEVARRGPALLIMSSRGDALYRRPHWRARSLRRRFGTPFVVDGRRSAEPPDHLLHRLRQVAAWAGR